MAILNYTTSISTEKTASEIQAKLVKAGAQAVLCEYGGDGIMSAISFRIQTPQGLIFFRLPSNKEGVLRALKSNRKIPSKLKTKDQASRVAWRILKDWIEAQLAIVEAEIAKISEVFLPYAQDPSTGETLYNIIENKGFQNLIEAPK